MLPCFFISHGAPDRAFSDSPARDYLLQFARNYPTPKGIVIISAHWQTRNIEYTKPGPLTTIHDFGGFSHELHNFQYPVYGENWLSDTVSELLDRAGYQTSPSDRGLDHGAWSPLCLMYPKSKFPVLALSLPLFPNGADYITLGKALLPLAEQDILIICSGSATHNLFELSRNPTPPSWATEFIDWLHQTVLSNNTQELSLFRRLAPHANKAHPSDEHFLPLLIAAGCSAQQQSTLIHDSYEYGSLNNSCFSFT